MRGEEGGQTVLNHLRSLIAEDTALSLFAARELAALSSASETDRLMAAEYLYENGEDQLDRLYAAGIQVKSGERDLASLEGIIQEVVDSGEKEALENLLRWSVWMGQSGLILDQLGWDLYREAGGAAEPYFEAMLAAGRYRELIALSERAYGDSGEDAPLYLYYRARAWQRLGDWEQANATLQLAVQVVDPDETDKLERKLFADQQWELLIRLYQRLLNEEPENLLFQQKYIAASYYLGNQDVLEEQLATIDLTRFEGQPAIQGFILYLRVILFNAAEKDHELLEKLLADYPEIFDFRLILGASYLLHGEPEVARSFLEGMPELTVRAPRFLRVSALMLGLSGKDLIPATEREYLLPREQYLLNRFGVGSTD
jgi:hypothetical protein